MRVVQRGVRPLPIMLQQPNKVATLDLRSMELEPDEVMMLIDIFKKSQVLQAADMRDNAPMGVDAANILVEQVLKADTNTISSFCGVTKTKISLSIPRKDNPETDLIFISTELEANSWAETNGGKGKPSAEVRRRSECIRIFAISSISPGVSDRWSAAPAAKEALRRLFSVPSASMITGTSESPAVRP